MKKGLFIVIEGIDGTGKSTTVNYIKYWAKRFKQSFLFTKEPAGTKFGNKVRDLILDPTLKLDKITQAYLFAATRRDHIKKVVSPALKQGKIVICDRFLLSSLAYQSNYLKLNKGSYFDVNKVKELNQSACGNIIPDLNIYFALPNDQIKNRINNRKDVKYDKFDTQVQVNTKFLAQLQRNYQIAIKQSQCPVLTVDSTQKPRQRAEQIWNYINSNL